MTKDDPAAALSAAECSARTGLTPRALRLYEEQGLIHPRRTAGGWRVYSAEDLARLNVITLLKSAGLTLVQIANVTGSGLQQPALEKIVAIQLETWKARRGEAERGLRIAEAALERLRGGHSLSVDDFCNLIRSLEMTQTHDTHASTSAEPDSGCLDDGLLARYAGFYQAGDWNVLQVRTEGRGLTLEGAGAPGQKIELRATSDCDFELGASGITISFDKDADGKVPALRLRMKGGEMTGTRIDARQADEVNARREERIRNPKPLPGSEAAARRLVEGLVSGHPPYEEMHPALAYATREQLPRLQAAAAYLGAVESITFQGVGNRGWDVYDFRHERGVARVRIVLRADGLITGALFAITEGPVSLGP